jgi:hypothetical protein
MCLQQIVSWIGFWQGHRGILEVFKSGDLILADEGFLILAIVPEGVSVIIPPFFIMAGWKSDRQINMHIIW